MTMRKLSPKLLLIIAAALSIICGILVYSYLSKAQPKEVKKETKAVVQRWILLLALSSPTRWCAWS